MADVHDVSAKERRRRMGAFSIPKGKSLIFYAFDLGCTTGHSKRKILPSVGRTKDLTRSRRAVWAYSTKTTPAKNDGS